MYKVTQIYPVWVSLPSDLFTVMESMHMLKGEELEKQKKFKEMLSMCSHSIPDLLKTQSYDMKTRNCVALVYQSTVLQRLVFYAQHQLKHLFTVMTIRFLKEYMW